MALMLCSSKLAYFGRFVSPHSRSRDLRLSAIYVSLRNHPATFLARIVEAFYDPSYSEKGARLAFDRFRGVFRAFNLYDLLATGVRPYLDKSPPGWHALQLAVRCAAAGVTKVVED